MLKSCTYCGRVHDNKLDCGKRPRRRKNTDIDKFRSTQAWQKKREEIRQRDKNLCQICIRKLYNTLNQFTYEDLSVHHAIPLDEDFTKRLDNDNLLTVCGYHHEMAERGAIPRAVILSIITEQEKGI